jgi:hypothetical protein
MLVLLTRVVASSVDGRGSSSVDGEADRKQASELRQLTRSAEVSHLGRETIFISYLKITRYLL